jgi:hypothetical protein
MWSMLTRLARTVLANRAAQAGAGSAYTQMEISLQQRDWNDLAAVDPLWAIYSAPGKRHGRWDADEFFQTGETEIEEVMGAGG